MSAIQCVCERACKGGEKCTSLKVASEQFNIYLVNQSAIRQCRQNFKIIIGHREMPEVKSKS